MPTRPAVEVGCAVTSVVCFVVSFFRAPIIMMVVLMASTPTLMHAGDGLCCMCCRRPILTAVMAVVLMAYPQH